MIIDRLLNFRKYFEIDIESEANHIQIFFHLG